MSKKKDTVPLSERYFVFLDRYAYGNRKLLKRVKKTGYKNNDSKEKFVFTAEELLKDFYFSRSIQMRIKNARVGTKIVTGSYHNPLMRIPSDYAFDIDRLDQSATKATERIEELQAEVERQCAELYEQKAEEQKMHDELLTSARNKFEDYLRSK